MKHFIVAICSFSVFVAYAEFARANGFGVTLDKVVGEYTANVDYDAITGLAAGDSTQFAFQLFNKDRSQQLDFTDVWVKIIPTNTGKPYNSPIFAGGIGMPVFGPPVITFAFPKSGSYDLFVRYENKDKSLVEATFPLVVSDSGNQTVAAAVQRWAPPFIVGAFTSFVCIFGIGKLRRLRRKRS